MKICSKDIFLVAISQVGCRIIRWDVLGLRLSDRYEFELSEGIWIKLNSVVYLVIQGRVQYFRWPVRLHASCIYLRVHVVGTEGGNFVFSHNCFHIKKSQKYHKNHKKWMICRSQYTIKCVSPELESYTL